MEILYAIQGTGNGHLSRARDIVPALKKIGNVKTLVSGIQVDVKVDFKIDYRFQGLSFIFGKSGGVDLFKTGLKVKPNNLLKEIKSLPVEEFDIVINDFEPVSAWACKQKKKLCIGLSHQAAVLNKYAPKPKKTDLAGKLLLNHYAPVNENYGFHFKRYDNRIFTPVIRKQIREVNPEDKGHITVYLPAYDDQRLFNFFSKIKDVKWEVFSKHNKEPIEKENVKIIPVNNDQFIESLVKSHGVFCGAGFETPAEALFLRKKLMVIPMKNQYEQHCNAAALEDMGVPVLSSMDLKYLDLAKDWVRSGKTIDVDYPDETEEILKKVINQHT